MYNIEQLYELYLQYPEIITDSRKAKPCSLFFALKGENFDGNNFAEQALKNGCNYAICDNEKVISRNKYILADNVLNTLQNLASYHRRKIGIPIIAVTGTNGKTTTKELIKNVLAKKYKVYATVGNLNNHLGVPLTLLNVEKNIEIAIIEMGANHIGEINSLCNIAQPDFGLITNIGKAHLEGFGSFEGVINAKSELYNYLNENNGIVFVNSDDIILTSNLKTFRNDIIKYGSGNGSICSGTVANGSFFLKLVVDTNGKKTEIQSQLYGEYNLNNILAAVCIGRYFNIDITDIKEAIESYIPQNNRSQIIRKGTNTIILDAYNANPSSMAEALNNFVRIKSGKKLIILGDMFELGEYSSLEHEKIVDYLIDNNLNNTIFVGENFHKANKFFFNAFVHITDLQKWLVNNKFENYYILIKGSRRMQLESILEYL